MSDPQYVHQEDEVLLAKVLRDSKPLLERYGTSLIYAVAAMLAAAAVYVYFSRQPQGDAKESAELLAAKTPEEFADLAETAVGTPIGVYARLREGEFLLRNALGNLFTNRKTGLEELDKAEKAFRKLEESPDAPEEVRIKVLVGLAKITEARCDGKDDTVKAALAAWDKVLTSFPASKMFSDLAESRKKKLESQDTKDFYAWFQQQDPKPGDDTGLPQDGPGAVPGIPNFDDLLKAPAPAGSTQPAAEPTPAEPKPEQPATPEPTPAEPKPEQPATPEPAPAEPKPEQPATPEPAPAEPKPEQPATPEPAPAEPKPEQPATPEPAPAEPKPEQPATPEPAPAEPKPEQPATPEPAPAEPKPEQPATPEKTGE